MVLGIYGAGDQGREVLVLAQQINIIHKHWEEIVFIDDNISCSSFNFIPMLTFSDAVKKYKKEELEFIIAVGEPYLRRLLREKAINSGYHLGTLIHPSIHIPSDTKVGRGTIINVNCFVSCNVKIGENVLIQPLASIAHDNTIGKDSVISTFVSLAGNCKIGNETYIGLQVPIKENTVVGNESIVGMGSIVLKDIPDGVVAFGQPARVMKDNKDHRVFG